MFESFTGNDQLDLQINRFMGPHMSDPSVRKDVEAAVSNLEGSADIAREFKPLAGAYEKAGKLSIAGSCYGLAAFYLGAADPLKRELIDGFRRCFYESWQGETLERIEVPYGSASLPVVRIRAGAPDTPRQPKTLLLFGGFDSYVEELVGFERLMAPAPFDVVAFDGPGQGTALLRGLSLTPDWERPVAAVLDALGIDSCAACGMSLGGCLVMRAAAREPRIKRVIALDVMYSMLDAAEIKLSGWTRWAFQSAVAHRRSGLIDAVAGRFATRSLDMAWKLRQARDLTGLEAPHDVIYEFQKYTIEDVLPFVKQRCLLLAGDADQYVPFERLEDVRRGLVNSEHVDVHAFRAADDPGAAQHCQVGNMKAAFDVIGAWLRPWAEGESSECF